MTDLLALGVDLETTGLTDDQPGGLYRGGRILEIGLALVRPDLSVHGAWHQVIRPDVPVEILRAECSQWVRDTHDASGLWMECEHGMPLADAVADALDWVAGHGVQRGELPLFGSSVHTDREWLKHGKAGEIERYAHYRNIDVSTIKTLAAAWWPQWVPGLTPRKAHRVGPDILDSRDELICYRDRVFRRIPVTFTGAAESVEVGP